MMLATPYRDQDPTGLWVSEKMDGCRAFWDGECFRTKESWAVIDAPAFMSEGLPRGQAIDGELWANRGTFEMVRQLVQYQRAASPDWSRVRFMAFDAPCTISRGFEERQEQLAALLANAGPHAELVQHWKCKGREQMLADFKTVLALGGEGLVLRKPGHFYAFGRSNAWLKVKPCNID